MPSFVNLTGKRFTDLLVLERVPPGNKSPKETYWKCRCECPVDGECNKEVVVTASGLRSGNTKRCYSCGRTTAGQKTRGERNGKYVGFPSYVTNLFFAYRRGANKRGLSCELSNDQMWALMQNPATIAVDLMLTRFDYLEQDNPCF